MADHSSPKLPDEDAFPELRKAMKTIVNTPKAAVEASIAKEHQKRTKPAKKK